MPAAGPALVGLVALVVGAAVRWWQISGRISLGWNDTADFLAAARSPWTSLDLWAGARPPAATVVLKLVGSDTEAYIRAQAVLGAACWAVLAASAATAVAGRGARWLTAAAITAFSVTTPVTMWDRSVLSESLAISTLALVVATVVQLARGVTPARAAAALIALGAWLATRDSHAVVALVAGGVALAVGSVAWWRARPVRAPAPADAAPAESPTAVGDAGGAEVPELVGGGAAEQTGAVPFLRRNGRHLASPRPAGGRVGAGSVVVWLGAGILVLGLVVMWASAHGERHAFPMRNVYEVRVLPYPDRVEWFADRGMPQAEVFAGPGARVPAVEPGIPPVMYVGDEDPELTEWLDWVETDGRATFARFVASHPLYLVAEPLRSPERAFNNALGDRSFYRPVDMPRVPVVDMVLARPTPLVVVVVALPVGWAIGRRRWTPLIVAGTITAGVAVPHGLLAWHSDGMETARHLVVPALQLHLGVLLMLIGALADIAASRAPTR